MVQRQMAMKHGSPLNYPTHGHRAAAARFGLQLVAVGAGVAPGRGQGDAIR